MSSHFFAMISRMKNIRRWGLMQNTYEENVQAHSHMVAVIAHALAVIGREVFSTDDDPGLAASAALYHDASEIFTGDLPTPVKYLNPQIKKAYKEVERLSCERLVSMLPEQLKGEFRALLIDSGGARTAQLVHAADKIAAHIKCVEELKSGNGEFKKAALQTRAAVSALDLPEADYFMEQFLPSFKLTLDEQE